MALPCALGNRDRKGPASSAAVEDSVCRAWRGQPSQELGEAEQSFGPPELQLVPGLKTLNHPTFQGCELKLLQPPAGPFGSGKG